jgi:hypothetical protein
MLASAAVICGFIKVTISPISILPITPKPPVLVASPLAKIDKLTVPLVTV